MVTASVPAPRCCVPIIHAGECDSLPRGWVVQRVHLHFFPRAALRTDRPGLGAMLLESPLCGRCHVLWAHRQPPCSAQSDAFQLQKVPQEGSTTAFVPTKQFPTAPHKCCILEPTLDRKKRPQSSSEAPNRSKYGLPCTRRGANGLGLKSAAVPHLAKTQLDTLPSPPSLGLPTRLGGPGT